MFGHLHRLSFRQTKRSFCQDHHPIFTYFALNKPYDCLSQFSVPRNAKAGQQTLMDLNIQRGRGGKDVYAVGRLDRDSEGLLVLSNDNKFTDTVLNSKAVSKEYYVQVEGCVTEAALEQLRLGVGIYAPVVDVEVVGEPILNNLDHEPPPADYFSTKLWPENHVRRRKKSPLTWLRVELDEGKNRQIRKMCAAVGHAVVRLIRWRIGALSLDMLGDTGDGALQPRALVEFKPSLLVPGYHRD